MYLVYVTSDICFRLGQGSNLDLKIELPYMRVRLYYFGLIEIISLFPKGLSVKMITLYVYFLFCK